ncbi:MAG: hypothetical protein AB7T22_00630 [Calditrichaceae bacterium]
MNTNALVITGEPQHKNLATQYTHMWLLIKDLKESRFSGYLKLEFWGYEGFLIFDTGNIVQAYEQKGKQIGSGIQALLGIYNRFREKDGSISTFLVDYELVPFLLAMFQNKILDEKKNLNSDNLEKYIQESSKKTDYGFINIIFGDQQARASIYLMNGGVAASVLNNNAGKQVFEKGMARLFKKILQIAETIDTNISLESCDALRSYEESQKFSELLELLEVSEIMLELKNRIVNAIAPLDEHENMEALFSGLWEKSCKSIGVDAVHYAQNQFTGLDSITKMKFGALITNVFTQLKPLFDDKSSKHSFMDLLIHGFVEEYSEKIDKIHLREYFSTEIA